MGLRINKNIKITPSISIDIIMPLISDRLTVKYKNKEYRIIGYRISPEKLFLQDPQQPDCELIVEVNKVKPLLRKMESMTNDEKKEYQSLLDGVANHTKSVWEVTEWLNKNQFDYKNLIGDKLAEEI